MNTKIIATLLVFCFIVIQQDLFATELDSNTEFSKMTLEAFEFVDQADPRDAPPVPPRKDLGETKWKAPSPQPAPPVPPRKDLGETKWKAPSPQPGAAPKANQNQGVKPAPGNNKVIYGSAPKLDGPSTAPKKSQYGVTPGPAKTNQIGKLPSNPKSQYGPAPGTPAANANKTTPIKYGKLPADKKSQYGVTPGPAKTNQIGKLPTSNPKSQYGPAPGTPAAKAQGISPGGPAYRPISAPKQNPKTLNKTPKVKSGLNGNTKRTPAAKPATKPKVQSKPPAKRAPAKGGKRQ